MLFWNRKPKQPKPVILGESRTPYPCPFSEYGCAGTLKQVIDDGHKMGGRPISPQVKCSTCGNLWLSDNPRRCSAQKPTQHELEGWIKKHPNLLNSLGKRVTLTPADENDFRRPNGRRL